MKKIQKGIYYINNWYICKISDYWYLLSDKEYEQNKNDLENFVCSYLIDRFNTRKELVETYKKSIFYSKIFKEI